ncbi:PREDICTED: uncharacterized protein LOC109219842 [Nicotiana attenuata]|uniref:uncharacterized protein LOC109219842 n=1 Tax=Nicotiana attenuata TaxID=49451 RepID=UPI00090487E6|nr:PREDICTED: uncharacterized protein LOC109219842 [Nicotiana attenuata]
MRNIKEARFPKPIRSDPSQRDPNLWSQSLKNSHLRELFSDRAKNNYGCSRDTVEPSKIGEDPPRLTINMIFGGNEINDLTFSAAKKTKVFVTYRKRLREVAKNNITFTKEDSDGLLLPHNDTLVISLNVLDLKIKRALVDPGSSANIIQWRVLELAKLTRSIILATKLLAGFNWASVTSQEEILLPTNAGGVTKTILFEVVDGDMGYNIILIRPWLHEMKATINISPTAEIPDPRGNQADKRRSTYSKRNECSINFQQ